MSDSTRGAWGALALLLSALPAPAAAERIAGSVVDRSGSAIGAAEIRFHAPSDPGGPGPAAAIAGPDGSFSLDIPSAGPWILWASAPGYLDGRAGPVTCPETGTATGVTVRLFRVGAGSMGGTVRDPEGAPIEGVRVEVKQPSLALGTPIVRTTDAQGRYRFEALSVGKVEFRFELGGSDVVSPVEGTGATAIKEGEELVRDVQFPRPNRSIEGVVLDAEGKPVAGGKVVCLFRPTFQERYVFRGGETKTDAAGNFRMENLVPGEYRVFFSGPAGEGGSTGRFFGDRAGVQPGGDPIEFRAPSPLPALISGKILNLDTGQGLAGSKVRLEVAGEILASDVSDVGGKFAFGARLSTTAPNILRVEHRNRGTEERWLVASEVRPDGSYPEVVFTVTRQRPESEPR